MDFEHIVAFLGSLGGSTAVGLIAWAVGRQMGRSQRQEYLEQRRLRREENALEMGGELTHWATPTEIDWGVWGPGELAPLWRLMERDGLKAVGSPADPDFLMSLIREMDNQQRIMRDQAIAEGVRFRDGSFEDRYRQARKAIKLRELRAGQPSLLDQARDPVAIERATPVSRGRQVALGGSYIFAFGHMPLSPVESFDRRLSMALGRIGGAAVSVDQQREEEQRRARKVDGR